MAIRSTHLIPDIQDCIYTVIYQLTQDTAPWTSWQVTRGWPDVPVQGEFVKPYIYVLPPAPSGFIRSIGRNAPLRWWELIVGLWTDLATGRADEMSIMISRMLQFFDTVNTCHTKQFTVTLGSTTYTNTTLTTQGVRVKQIIGPSYEMGEDDTEFRREMTLELIA